MFKTDAPALLVWADRTPSSCAACHWTVSSSCVSHVPSSLCQWRSKGPLDADVQLYLGLMTGFLANSVAGSCPEYKQQHYIQGLRTTDTSWARAGLGAKEQQHGLCLRLKCSRCIRRVHCDSQRAVVAIYKLLIIAALFLQPSHSFSGNISPSTTLSSLISLSSSSLLPFQPPLLLLSFRIFSK